MSILSAKTPPGVVIVEPCAGSISRNFPDWFPATEFLSWGQVEDLDSELLSVYFKEDHVTFLLVDIFWEETQYKLFLLAKLASVGSNTPVQVKGGVKSIVEIMKQFQQDVIATAKPEIVSEIATGGGMKVCVVNAPFNEFSVAWQNSPDIDWLDADRFGVVSLGDLARDIGVSYCFVFPGLDPKRLQVQTLAFSKYRARSNLIQVESRRDLLTQLILLGVRTGKAVLASQVSVATKVMPLEPPETLMSKGFAVLLVGFDNKELSAEILNCPKVCLWDGEYIPLNLGIVLVNQTNLEAYNGLRNYFLEFVAPDCILKTATKFLNRDWQKFIAGCENGVEGMSIGQHSVLVIGANMPDFDAQGRGELYKDPRVLHWGISKVNSSTSVPSGIERIVFMDDSRPSKAPMIHNMARIEGIDDSCKQVYSVKSMIETLDGWLKPTDGVVAQSSSQVQPEIVTEEGHGKEKSDDEQQSNSNQVPALDKISLEDLLARGGLQPLYQHFGNDKKAGYEYLISRGLTESQLTRGAFDQRILALGRKSGGVVNNPRKAAAPQIDLKSETAKKLLGLISSLEGLFLEISKTAAMLATENNGLKELVEKQAADLTDLPRLRESEADFNRMAEFFTKRFSK